MLSDINAAILKNSEKTRPSSETAGPLSTWHYQQLQKEVGKINNQLSEVKMTLHLESHPDNLGATILSRCSKMWQTLCDLKTSRLRGYGKTPDHLPAYLDPRIDEMIRRVEKTLDIVKKHDNNG